MLNSREQQFILKSLRERSWQKRLRNALVATAFVVLSALTLWAVYEQQLAIKNARTADSRRLAEQAKAAIAMDTELSLLLALEAINMDTTFDALNALKASLDAAPHLERILKHKANATNSMLYIQEQGLCITYGKDSNIYVLNADSEELTYQIPGTENSAAMTYSRPLQSLFAINAQGDVCSIGLLESSIADTLELGDKATAIAIDETGRLLAIGTRSGIVMLRDLAHPEQPLTWTLSVKGSIERLAFSPDGRWLALIEHGNPAPVIIEVSNGQIIPHAFQAHAHPNNPLLNLHFADSTTLLSASVEGILRYHDLSTWTTTQKHSFPDFSIQCMDVSPDRTTLALGGMLNRQDTSGIYAIRLVNLENGKLKHELEGHHGIVRSLFFMDGHRLISCDENGVIMQWHPRPRYNAMDLPEQVNLRSADAHALQANAECLLVAQDTILWAMYREHGFDISQRWRLKSRVEQLNINREGTEVILAYEDGQIEIRELTPEFSLLFSSKHHWEEFADVALSKDASRYTVSGDSHITVWSRATGKVVDTAFSTLSWNGGEKLAFHPDNTILATSKKHAVLWNLDRGALVGSELAPAKDYWLQRLAISANGQQLAGINPVANQVELWNLQNMRKYWFSLSGPVQGDLAFTERGDSLLAIDMRGNRVLSWNVHAEHWIQQACQIVSRPLSIAERLAHGLDTAKASTCHPCSTSINPIKR